MEKLPKWCVTDKFPALYDVESATAIEMVAKLYGAMNSLIEEYNNFVDNINESVGDFTTTATNDNELFRISLRQEFQDFIDTVELYLKQNGTDGDEYLTVNEFNEFKANIETFVSQIVNNIVTNLEGVVSEQEFATFKLEIEQRFNNIASQQSIEIVYDAENEAITFNIDGGE